MKMRVQAGLILLAAAVMGLASCDHYVCGSGPVLNSSGCTAGTSSLNGGGTTSGTPAALEYFIDTGSIGAASLDTSNNYNLIPNFTSPQQNTLDFDGMTIVQQQWLYVDLMSSIEAYSIDGTTGDLTAITGSPWPSGNIESSCFITDPAGKFLFMCGANQEQVTVFAINQSTGALTTVGVFSTGFDAIQATTDGLGKFLYVTAGNLGSTVAVFSIGSSGSLTPIVGSPFSISIAQLEGEPTGKFLVGVTGNGANNGFTTDNHVYVFAINQTTGALTPVLGSPFATTYTPGSLVVHPSGTFVYTFNETVSVTSPMEGFQFNSTTGTLTPLANSPFTTLEVAAGIFDQSGAYLFMNPDSTLTVATVDTTTGALTSISSPIPDVGSVAGDWAVTDPQ
jgi:hypothetical protein